MKEHMLRLAIADLDWVTERAAQKKEEFAEKEQEAAHPALKRLWQFMAEAADRDVASAERRLEAYRHGC